MRGQPKPVGWLCAGALVAAAATAGTVNSSEAALFGVRTTGIVGSCTEYKGKSCEVSIPQRPERTFKVSVPRDTRRDTKIAVRYRDDSVFATGSVSDWFRSPF